MLIFSKARSHIKILVVLALVFIAYLLGIRMLLSIALVLIGAFYLPMPKIFSSFVSRLIVSFFINFGLLQIVAVIQFLLFPHSNFNTAALIYVLIAALTIIIFGQLKAHSKIVDRKDLCAFIVILFFVLPFSLILTGQRSTERIASIGSIQSVDATHQYIFITEMGQTQHLDYGSNIYYPKTFHLAVAFLEGGIFGKQGDRSWLTNTRLYFLQYLFFGSTLAYTLYYTCRSWFEDLTKKRQRTNLWLELIMAASLGLPLAIFYLLPFVDHGFLNYYYVAITALLGLIYWAEQSHQSIIFGLLLIFGVSASWPLLTPALLLTLIVLTLPSSKHSLKTLFKKITVPQSLAVVAMIGLQLVPIYFQLKYSKSFSTLRVDLTGDLTVLHPLILLLGLFLVLVAISAAKFTDQFKKLVYSVFIPLYLLTGTILGAQYFMFGEARYYAIKVSLILEILILALSVVMLFYGLSQSLISGWLQLAFLPIIVLFGWLLLTTTAPSPLKDVRDLFRDYSGQGKPPYLDQDVFNYTNLGTSNQVKNYNNTILHYDSGAGHLIAHMQTAAWASVMHYDGKSSSFKARDCFETIYNNLAYGTQTPPEQQQLVKDIKNCATIANQSGLTYYIVTDSQSLPHIQSLFGNMATYVK